MEEPARRSREEGQGVAAQALRMEFQERKVT